MRPDLVSTCVPGTIWSFLFSFEDLKPLRDSRFRLILICSIMVPLWTDADLLFLFLARGANCLYLATVTALSTVAVFVM